MTNALLWSRVRLREEYGTLSNSSSVKMSSPSVLDTDMYRVLFIRLLEMMQAEQLIF